MKRMEGWKTKCPSLAGRITLTKFVITSMPLYQMQSALLPGSVTKELDRVVWKCVWAGSEERRKIHLIKWDVLCKLKEEGGIGLCRTEERNKAILVKLRWRLTKYLDAFWSRTLVEKYGKGREGLNLFKHKSGGISYLARYCQ